MTRFIHTRENTRSPLLIRAIGFLLLFAVLLPMPAVAQIAFTQLYPTGDLPGDMRGDIVVFGNTLMTTDGSENGVLIRDGGGGAGSGQGSQDGPNNTKNNNAWHMRYVKERDSLFGGTVFNSSTSQLNLPPNSTIRWAGLFWGARTTAGTGGAAAQNNALRGAVRFLSPSGSRDVTGTVISTIPGVSLTDGTYRGYADVTQFMNGNGEYGVANVQAGTGQDRFAVWSLVVVYENPNELPKNLTVFSGMDRVQSGNGNDRTIEISGLFPPQFPGGTVKAKIGFVAYEGDAGMTGDKMDITAVRQNGTNGSNMQLGGNSVRPSTNFFNSSITLPSGTNNQSKRPGTGDIARPLYPDYLNQLGVDIGLISIDGLFQPNDRGAKLHFTSTNDIYFPVVATMAIDIEIPNINVGKLAFDDNGDNVTPGDILTYEIDLSNILINSVGDASVNTLLTDLLPEHVQYVDGSMILDQTIESTRTILKEADGQLSDRLTKTTAGEQEKLEVKIGKPSHTESGKTDAWVFFVGDSAKITFKVRVKNTVPHNTDIINQAELNFKGRTSEINLIEKSALNTVNNSKAIQGVVFEDIHYGGGQGRGPIADFSASNLPLPKSTTYLDALPGAKPISGARVELYRANDNQFVTVTYTDSNGVYSFDEDINTEFSPSTQAFKIRVVTNTILSSRGAAAGTLPILTYLTKSTQGPDIPYPAPVDPDLPPPPPNIIVDPVLDRVGGLTPHIPDSGEVSTGALPANSHAVAEVVVGQNDLLRIDFGFNFDTVVNTNATGQGSLTQVITNANALSSDTALVQENHPPGVENVIFNFPAGTSFPAAIAKGATPLPNITERLYLDASIQNGVQNTSGTPQVYLDGSGTAGNGFSFVGADASNSLVKNFAIGNFNGHGIYFASSSGHQIKGNLIGLTPTQAPAGNRGSGIYINSSSNNVIGGGNNGDPNVIANNGITQNEGGVFIQNGTANTISRNSIFRNKGLGIDISPKGVNGNDGNISGAGDNNGIDYPVFTAIDLANGTVAGHVGSAGGSSVYSGSTVEIFISDDDGDQNGPVYAGDNLSLPHGEGKTYLGSLSVGSDGKFSGSVNFSGHTGTLTATTTYLNSTSEFGPNEAIGATLSGVVYEDLNLNNQYDTTPTPEPGPGTEHPLFAKLINESAPSVAVQTVPVDPTTGAYSFPGVSPNTYTIVISLDGDDPNNVTPAYPAGWGGRERPTGQQTGIVVQLAAIANLNFGFSLQSNLTGRVFLDTGVSGQAASANNGSFDSGESGISSVQVSLLINGTPSGDPVATGADGTFSIALPSSLAENDNIQLVQAEIPQHLSTGTGRVAVGTEPARAFDRATRTLSFVYQSSLPPEAFSGLDFGNIPPSTFDTDGQQNGLPGSIIFFPHTFTAGSDGVVTFSTTAQADPNLTGWAETLFLDQNSIPGTGGQPDAIGDGTFTPEHDTPITGPITVKAGEKVKILVKEFIPIGAPYDARNIITVTADITYTNSDHAMPEQTILTAQLQRKDLAIVGDTALQLVKKVDKEQAKPGELLTYTLTYLNNGPTPLAAVVIHDTTPEYTVFDSAPDPIIPAGLEETLNILKETPEEGASGALKWTFDAPLPSGVTGEVIFKVKVQGGTTGTPPPPGP